MDLQTIRERNKLACGPTTGQVDWLIAEIERLQKENQSALVCASDCQHIGPIRPALVAARGEVRRLTAANADLLAALQIVKEQRQSWWGKAIKRRAERDRYKAALESIIRAECHHMDDDGNEEYCCCHDDAECARKALAGAAQG